jgi:diguanylate cyclase (GGDEF)-like protein/PAS domain S-box-containing protein
MFKRLRAFAQTTTYLGVAVIACIWLGVFVLISEERARAERDGVRQANNFVRVFEAYIARVFAAADAGLLNLRESYEHDPQHFDIARPVNRTQFQNNIIMQFAITGGDGFTRLSSIQTIDPEQRAKEDDRDYFRFHVNSKDDELFISAPSMGRVSKKLVFHLTRRLMSVDGSFDGVILATIDVLELEKFYNAIDLGQGGIISLVGFDGIVRARSGQDPSAQTFVGRSNAQTQVFSAFRQSPTGTYWNIANSKSKLDGINRLISYRVVEGFPLIAVVGLAERDIFEQATETAHKCYLIGSLLTACVLVVIGIGARSQRELSSTVDALERSKGRLEESKLSLEQTNLWFNTALENMVHGLCMFDRNARLIVSNSRYGSMYGLAPDQVRPGTTVRSILEARVAAGGSPEDGKAYIQQTEEMIRRREPYYDEVELRDKRIMALHYQPMEGGGWVAVHQDITARKRAETQIAYIAHHDGLTGIANRTVLLERMNEALTRVRECGETFAVFILDLDLFKTINDSLGHPVGDELLKVVAKRLSECVQDADTIARLGGDEFAVLARAESDQREAAILTATRLLEAVAAPFEVDGHHIDIGVSIGIALAPAHGTDVDQLMKNADLALYKAKADGRDRYRFFEDSMGVEARTRRALQSDLRTALTNEQFEVHYHPIVDIKSMETTGVEALIRWRHPERGMIAPGDFISVAEETSLINPIGKWVLRKACSDAVAWPPNVKVSVNLSPIQFRRLSPIDIFCDALADSGLSPERLEVEITESVLLHASEETIQALHQLRSMGISIVLDDFGTGYSSLSYLRMFPFDKIKIDRSFVHELSKSSDCASIVSAVASLGRSLQIATVAEGIETEDQLILVRAAGCTHAQGFLFGRPCPAAELRFGALRERPAIIRAG